MDEIASFFLVEDTFSTSRCLYDLVTLVTIEKKKKKILIPTLKTK